MNIDHQTATTAFAKIAPIVQFPNHFSGQANYMSWALSKGEGDTISAIKLRFHPKYADPSKLKELLQTAWMIATSPNITAIDFADICQKAIIDKKSLNENLDGVTISLNGEFNEDGTVEGVDVILR